MYVYENASHVAWFCLQDALVVGGDNLRRVAVEMKSQRTRDPGVPSQPGGGDLVGSIPDFGDGLDQFQRRLLEVVGVV